MPKNRSGNGQYPRPIYPTDQNGIIRNDRDPVGYYSGNWQKWFSNHFQPLIRLLLGRNRQISSSIFSPEQLGIPANPSIVFNGFKSLQGASLVPSIGSSSFAVAAANSWRVQTLFSDSANVAAAFTSNDTVPHFVDVRSYLEFDSDNPFAVFPFIVLMENGEVITNTDSALTSLAAVVTSALPGQTRNIVYGPVVKSSRFRDNGSDRYRAALGMTVTELYYVRHYREMLMKEENPLVLVTGCAILGVATKTVNYNYTAFNGQIQRDPSLLGDI
jgi:hypothetical protein